MSMVHTPLHLVYFIIAYLLNALLALFYSFHINMLRIRTVPQSDRLINSIHCNYFIGTLRVLKELLSIFHNWNFSVTSATPLLLITSDGRLTGAGRHSPALSEADAHAIVLCYLPCQPLQQSEYQRHRGRAEIFSRLSSSTHNSNSNSQRRFFSSETLKSQMM